MKLLVLSKFSFTIIALLLIVGCEGKNEDLPPSPVSFDGVISFNLNISASPTCGEAISLYTSEYQGAYSFGARGAQTAAPWGAIEDGDGSADPGEDVDGFDLVLVNNSYFGLGAIQGYGYTDIFFNLPSLTHTGKKFPADISVLAFNHATVKARYRRAIDKVVPYLNDSVKYFSLGNEVDSYLTNRPVSEWVEYKELIEDARSYLKSLKPSITVGITTTFNGFSNRDVTNVASLNENMDAVFLTYYPISSSFIADDPSVVSTDMRTMSNLAGSKKVILQEWGYPSSSTNSGSESKQATFISNTFDEWKALGSSQFPFISFFKRREWNACECAAQTSSSPGNPFYDFMCSLGILNNNSSPKSSNSTLSSKMAELGIP
jgi:hypothetical protein